MFNKSCRWLDLNQGPLVSEATALPTALQPLPTLLHLFVSFFICFFWFLRVVHEHVYYYPDVCVFICLFQVDLYLYVLFISILSNFYCLLVCQKNLFSSLGIASKIATPKQDSNRRLFLHKAKPDYTFPYSFI